jgi:hypothetical protein
VSTAELTDVGLGSVRHRPLQARGDDVVSGADQIPRGDSQPGGNSSLIE